MTKIAASAQSAKEKLDYVSQRFDEVLAFRDSLNSESDRGCALMAAAYLHTRLESLLRGSFVAHAKLIKSLFDGDRPLANFSAQIDVAFATGLISKEAHRDLHLVRKIRNEFAHDFRKLLFTSNGIRQRCSELKHYHDDPKSTPRQLLTRAVMVLLAEIDSALPKTKRTSPRQPILNARTKSQISKDVQRIIDELKGMD